MERGRSGARVEEGEAFVRKVSAYFSIDIMRRFFKRSAIGSVRIPSARNKSRR